MSSTQRGSVIAAFIIANHLLLTAGSAAAEPFNVTVKELNSTTALVTWWLDFEQLNSSFNSTEETPFRLEITYRMHHERQKLIIAVPSDVTSYILNDLRPGGIYTVRVSSVSKGHRIKSQPVRFFMSRPVHSAGPPPYATSSWTPTPPIFSGPPPLFIVPPSSPGLLPPSPGQFRNNRSNFSLGPADYRFPPTANSAGVIYVRGEEVGIVVLVLIVWVAAVALFFHRWGKIRMLLPYQPVFKEEEPAIVGCSPSPTALQLSQQAQLLPSSSLSQSQPPVPPSAVHVSANKFVSLDPAAVRRNQFMLHSRLARMQAYTERRNWPASMSRLDNHCIIVGRSPLPAVRQKAYAGRRANTIAADNCDCCERPAGACRRQNDPGHQHRYSRGRYPKFSSESGSCSCEEQPRKAHSAEVITLTVTSCDSPTNSAGHASSSSTPDLPERSQSPVSNVQVVDSSPPPSKPKRPTDFQPKMAECSL